MEESPFAKFVEKSKDQTGPIILINLLDIKQAGEKEISERLVELIKPHLTD